METATLRYLDSLGTVQKKDFEVLSVEGLDIPKKLRFIPPQIYDIVDGSKATEYRGFQKIIGVSLSPINSNETFIEKFLQAGTKSLAYQGINVVSEEDQVVFETAEFESEHFDGFKYEKLYKFELTEKTVRHVWGFPTIPIVDNMIGYIKIKVKIEGTQASPETLTTNTGKLAYNFNTTVFPAISLLNYNVSVICNGTPYQSGKINQVGDVSQSGSDITFQLAHSDSENPSDDGFWYADLVIVLQAIT